MGFTEMIADAGIPVVSDLFPKKPGTVASTPAGKQASQFADSLVNTASGQTAPTPGTASTVGGDPAAIARAQAAYDEAQRQLQAAQMAATRTGGMSAGTSNPDPYSSPRYLAAKEAADKAKAALDQAKSQLTTAKTDLTPFLATGSAAAGASGGPSQINATQVNASPLNFAASLTQQAQGNQIGQQGPIQVQRVADPVGVTAQQFAAPTIGAAPMVTAERIGEMRLEGVPDDITLAGSLGRDAQLEALQLYRDAASGKAPSAAMELAQSTIDQGIGSAYGLAASLQGRNPGMAMREGLDAAGKLSAEASGKLGALRAQEMETARAGLAALGSKISDQDFQVAATNQTKNLTVAVTNLEAKIKTAIANQDAALRAGLGNQAAQVQTNIAQMQAQLETLKANASNSLTADIATMTAKLDASKANAANDLAAKIQDSQANMQRLVSNQRTLLEAGIHDQANELQAEINRVLAQLDADKANQQALLDAAKATAADSFNWGQLGQQNNQFNASLTQQNSQFNAGQRQQIAEGNANRDMAQQTINNALYASLTGNALSGLGLTTGIAAGDIARQTQYDQAKQQFWGNLVSGGAKSLATGGIGGGTTSTPVPYQTGPDGLIQPAVY